LSHWLLALLVQGVIGSTWWTRGGASVVPLRGTSLVINTAGAVRHLDVYTNWMGLLTAKPKDDPPAGRSQCDTHEVGKMTIRRKADLNDTLHQQGK
jgi:hypothetical protein